MQGGLGIGLHAESFEMGEDGLALILIRNNAAGHFLLARSPERISPELLERLLGDGDARRIPEDRV